MAGHPRPYDVAAAVRSALQRYYRRTDEICSKHGLTPAQYTLLLMIKGSENGLEKASVGELAERLQLAHNGVAERIRRAETADLVQRERDPTDGRVSLIRLTTEGDRRLRRAFSDLGDESDRFISAIASVDRGDRRRDRATRR